jgi:hypothetical protein
MVDNDLVWDVVEEVFVKDLVAIKRPKNKPNTFK